MTGRGCGCIGRSYWGKAMRLRTTRAPRKRRRAATGPTSIEEEPSAKTTCTRVDGRRLDRLCVCADPSDHVEEARGWWNSGMSVRSYRWTIRWRTDRGEGTGNKWTSVAGRGGPMVVAEEVELTLFLLHDGRRH
ncbi:hypothetical protein BHE74_00014179 [Ensete ventricosum]|nr:hypothetical protein BHE74_00014179 [Ensete ventricosum]